MSKKTTSGETEAKPTRKRQSSKRHDEIHVVKTSGKFGKGRKVRWSQTRGKKAESYRVLLEAFDVRPAKPSKLKDQLQERMAPTRPDPSERARVVVEIDQLSESLGIDGDLDSLRNELEKRLAFWTTYKSLDGIPADRVKLACDFIELAEREQSNGPTIVDTPDAIWMQIKAGQQAIETLRSMGLQPDGTPERELATELEGLRRDNEATDVALESARTLLNEVSAAKTNG